MSPEQARGQSADKRSDVWAFGCVLYGWSRVLRRLPPKTSPTIVRILRWEPEWRASRSSRRRSVDVAAMSEGSHSPPARVADALLEIDERARLLSLPSLARRSLSTGVGRLLTHLALVDSGGSGVRVAVHGSAVAIRPSGSVAPLQQRRRGYDIATPATHVLSKISSPLSRRRRTAGSRSTPRAVGGARLQSPPPDVRRSRRRRGDARALKAPAPAPFLSPDGRWLGFYADGALNKVSVAGGVPLTICDAPPVWSATWGESDRIVFATTLAASGSWLVAANGSEPEQITTRSLTRNSMVTRSFFLAPPASSSASGERVTGSKPAHPGDS